MIEDASPENKPHQNARLGIELWRGHCLDLFARGEKVIGQTLEAMRNAAKEPTSVKLRHLAGQRADELSRQIASLEMTAKQSKVLVEAVAGWRAHEANRVFLAHATLAVTMDSRGKWFAIFDMTVYRSEVPHFERWSVSENEAIDFASKLESCGKQLSAQLGQVRKRLGS